MKGWQSPKIQFPGHLPGATSALLYTELQQPDNHQSPCMYICNHCTVAKNFIFKYADVPGVFILCMHAVSSSAITTGQPSKCMWLLTQLPYR